MTSRTILTFAASLALGVTTVPAVSNAGTRTTKGATSMSDHDAQVNRFKPSQGVAATNRNDVRQFVYDWFTHFEHVSGPEFYVAHLDDKDMSLSFPGMPAMTTSAEFVRWYANLLAQTEWNFHDLSTVEVEPSGPGQFAVSFIVDWYGEVRAASTQRAAWQSRPDSRLYHHRLRQTWVVGAAGQRLVIKSLVVTAGDTPSPIAH